MLLTSKFTSHLAEENINTVGDSLLEAPCSIDTGRPERPESWETGRLQKAGGKGASDGWG